MVVSNMTRALRRALPGDKNHKESPTATAQAADPRRESSIPFAYFEHEPTVWGEIKALYPSKEGAISYLQSLFPFLSWLPHYNRRWLLGDSIAGLTVGLVIVPQAMAYALLATLTPEFGLYTSFTGAATYFLFGTSKDIVIGTTAVGSLLVGSIITDIQNTHPGVYSSVEIAKALTFTTGAMLLTIGLLRLGWIVEVVPYIPVSAFITAASITIMSTQFPVMMGIPGVNTREEPYQVIIHSLKSLPNTQLDAAIGVTCLILLEVIKYVCTKLEKRQPSRQRFWATLSSLRMTVLMLFYTLIGWLVHRDIPWEESKFRMVGPINSGFQYAGPPRMDADLLRLILPQTPIIMLILVIEHIAIAKNFGTRYGYRINPSQEIMSQGTANLLGPFVGGYACTGSFGASAVLTKAGVRTPLAGLFSAGLLLLALYALTTVFAYIPRAALAGLIIHAVANLVASPATVRGYWQISPFECMIWVIGVVVAIFAGLEAGIYTTIALSIVLLLIRIARTQGQFLGSVQIQSIGVDSSTTTSAATPPTTNKSQPMATSRQVFMPLHSTTSAGNPDVFVHAPEPGVFIYRFPVGFNYLNQALHLNHLTSYVTTHTRRTLDTTAAQRRDALWCDSAVPKQQMDCNMPLLRAVVLDFSSVDSIDITTVKGLIDARNTLNRHAAPHVVQWHFASLWNAWARRSLARAGFGPAPAAPSCQWTPVYSVAGCLNETTPNDVGVERVRHVKLNQRSSKEALITGDCVISRPESTHECVEPPPTPDPRANVSPRRPVFGVDRPFFHTDLDEAVLAATMGGRPSEA